eukprot:178202-Pyramimonas_sp.AAC.1
MVLKKIVVGPGRDILSPRRVALNEDLARASRLLCSASRCSAIFVLTVLSPSVLPISCSTVSPKPLQCCPGDQLSHLLGVGLAALGGRPALHEVASAVAAATEIERARDVLRS